MDQDRTANKALMSLRMAGLVSTEGMEDVRNILKQVFTAGCEWQTRQLQAVNKKQIIQFDKQGNKIGEYGSIIEAANEIGIKRDVIDKSLHGRIDLSKSGYYFRYAEKKKQTA